MNKQKMNDHRLTDDEYEADQKASDYWAIQHASRVEDAKALLYDGEPTNVEGFDFIHVFSAALEELTHKESSRVGGDVINYHLRKLFLTTAWSCPVIHQKIQAHLDTICADAVTTEMEAAVKRGSKHE